MGLLRSAVVGVAAGAVATLAMDLVWYRRFREGGGDASFSEWALTSSATSFDEAPAPAQVGKLVAAAVGVELPTSSIAAANTVVHWATGTSWGAVGGVAATLIPVPSLAIGVATGAAAWATSYGALGAVGIYEPITSYDGDTLWKDFSAHLVFGTTLGVALALARRQR
ncbi:MAG: hypothetical protein M3501_07465 [Actinomycetota bacterium]|nr:hypothetical protein [Actinomycetota bacterium]